MRKLIGSLFIILGIIAGGEARACEEEPGDLTISEVTGAQETDVENYYIVVIPTGETPVTVTVKGSGETPCPTDSEKCVCKGEKADPPTDGDPIYTFSNTVGTQDPEGGDSLTWEVTSATEPGEYKFKLTKIEQKYGSCPEGWTGGVASKENTKESVEVTIAAVKVEIDKCAETFLPLGGQQDNETQITARILPNSLKGKFTLTLTGVSNEPGFCMNAPLQVPGSGEDSASWKDLQFKETQAGYTVSGTNKETIKNDEELNVATVAVKSFDYGANGQLKAVATIKTVAVTGYAKGEQEKDSVYIPQDSYDSPNQIAESAAQNSGPGEGKAKADDTDNAPAGDGTDGDLLTRYEEYRGFMIGGAHARTAAPTKTVFAVDKTGHTPAAGGTTLSLFSGTGFDCRFPVDGEYVQNNRRINSNGGSTAQRAVILENSKLVNSGWGLTSGNRPSTYEWCRINIEMFTRQLELAMPLPRKHLVYSESDDAHGAGLWEPNGRVKVGNSVIGYATAEEGINKVSATLNEVQIPADCRTIIIGANLSGLRFGRYCLINDAARQPQDREIIEKGTLVQKASRTLSAAVGADDQQIPLSSSIQAPAGGNIGYARIGAEWISFTGITGSTLTGVTRGVLNTAKVAHAANANFFFPHQWQGCTRGVLETNAAAIPVGTEAKSVGVLMDVQNPGTHAVGAQFGIFENVDDAIRMTSAHEVTHATGVDHHANNIMHDGLQRGRYLGAAQHPGLYNQYSADALKELNAR